MTDHALRFVAGAYVVLVAGGVATVYAAVLAVAWRRSPWLAAVAVASIPAAYAIGWWLEK